MPRAAFWPPEGSGFVYVSPPTGGNEREGEGEGEGPRESRPEAGGGTGVVDVEVEGANGAESSSGYVWKKSGVKVVPKNAPGY